MPAADLTVSHLRQVIRSSVLRSHAVCIHASFRSFGLLDGGPDDVIDSFVGEGCTLLVPSFSFCAYSVPPPRDNPRPDRNGTDYLSTDACGAGDSPTSRAFTHNSNELDVNAMGVVSSALLQRQERARGNHPLCSFASLGPLANDLVAHQSYEDVFAPLERLAEVGGYFLLAGVGLDRLTGLHLAEERSGRRMFVRWARVPDGVAAVRVGGCSEGFERLAWQVADCEVRLAVGRTTWRICAAEALLKRAAAIIAADPAITACPDVSCVRCQDAVAGGPEW